MKKIVCCVLLILFCFVHASEQNKLVRLCLDDKSYNNIPDLLVEEKYFLESNVFKNRKCEDVYEKNSKEQSVITFNLPDCELQTALALTHLLKMYKEKSTDTLQKCIKTLTNMRLSALIRTVNFADVPCLTEPLLNCLCARISQDRAGMEYVTTLVPELQDVIITTLLKINNYANIIAEECVPSLCSFQTIDVEQPKKKLSSYFKIFSSDYANSICYFNHGTTTKITALVEHAPFASTIKTLHLQKNTSSVTNSDIEQFGLGEITSIIANNAELLFCVEGISSMVQYDRFLCSYILYIPLCGTAQCMIKHFYGFCLIPDSSHSYYYINDMWQLACKNMQTPQEKIIVDGLPKAPVSLTTNDNGKKIVLCTKNRIFLFDEDKSNEFEEIQEEFINNNLPRSSIDEKVSKNIYRAQLNHKGNILCILISEDTKCDYNANFDNKDFISMWLINLESSEIVEVKLPSQLKRGLTDFGISLNVQFLEDDSCVVLSNGRSYYLHDVRTGVGVTMPINAENQHHSLTQHGQGVIVNNGVNCKVEEIATENTKKLFNFFTDQTSTEEDRENKFKVYDLMRYSFPNSPIRDKTMMQVIKTILNNDEIKLVNVTPKKMFFSGIMRCSYKLISVIVALCGLFLINKYR